jgi:hypothetical protein
MCRARDGDILTGIMDCKPGGGRRTGRPKRRCNDAVLKDIRK